MTRRHPLRYLTTILMFCALLAASLPAAASEAPAKRGRASWYGDDLHGKKTASGEAYDMNALTAAHKTLPLGTVVRVTNLSNGRSVLVTVNDRGPYRGNRDIDVSYSAAKQLGIVRPGSAAVRIEVLGDAKGRPLDPDSAYFVRIRSYASKAEAERLVRKLEREGEAAARVRTRTENGRKRWMVCVGPFRDFDDARALRRHLMQRHADIDIVADRARD
ncbi:septal ring lytic transglycosylase RlpA family protein [Nitratidesulfovibrio sp.]|uniref:septal ring lytic transglycosylase RlpA family protein n=1 Tax=Nitratidesulfovibrio sp. TaxID=2802297 RepID=UPI00333FA259